MKLLLHIVSILFFISSYVFSQFVDNFNSPSIDWTYFGGDGNVEMDFRIENGAGELNVDASEDVNNIWWALIKKNITTNIDLALLSQDEYELRIEAKLKVSHAPKRLNLHFNTLRTTDFHSNLMEYEIQDTNNWHIISMTTNGFDAIVGDSTYVQLALMDWGSDNYEVLVDYIKVDVIHKNLTEKDLGNIVPYHPTIPSVEKFNSNIKASNVATISTVHTNENFSQWQNHSNSTNENVVSVSSDQIIIMKWDSSDFRGMTIQENGLLELTLHSFQTGRFSLEELGQVRLVEIFDGNPKWEENTVTFNNFTNEKKLDEVFNSQHIYDLDLSSQSGSKKYFTVSKFVLNRIISSETIGLALKALGPINANINIGEGQKPTLYVNNVLKNK